MFRPRMILRWLGAVSALSIGVSFAAGAEPFPEPRPETRAGAARMLCEGARAPGRCVRAAIHGGLDRPSARPAAVRRALELLDREVRFAREEVFQSPGGPRIRYTSQPTAPDRVAPGDANGNGTPDVVEATALGLAQVRALVHGPLELPREPETEVVLVELGEVDGYVLPGSDHGRTAEILLDATPDQGPDGARRAAVRLYALAAATLSPGPLAVDWGEAFAVWALMTLDGDLDDATVDLLSARLRELSRGLSADDPDLVAGNALWFSFLEQAYGLSAVRLTLEELTKPVPVAVALDRAVRRASTDDLRAAFREFHLWTLLIGDRADDWHFPFARRLGATEFAALREGLPALSVQAEPPVAPLGATQIRLLPQAGHDGLRIHFEGDFVATWDADLVLVGERGTLRRLPLELSAEGRGELTVPLDDVREVLLLVRELASVDGSAHRYSYAAHLEKGFPFEIASLDASRVEGPPSGVLVRWETTSEQQLVGFNVLRAPLDGTEQRVVNPVWVPAAGGRLAATSYRFLDRGADPDTAYVYRIEGITTTGLTTRSEPFVATPASDRPR